MLGNIESTQIRYSVFLHRRTINFIDTNIAAASRRSDQLKTGQSVTRPRRAAAPGKIGAADAACKDSPDWRAGTQTTLVGFTSSGVGIFPAERDEADGRLDS